MSHLDHKHGAPSSVAFAVLTVSDTRDEAGDKTGQTLIQMATDASHALADYRIVKDEAEAIAMAVSSWIADERVQMIIVNGGTGVAPRDVTVEAVRPLLEKELPGFGELFRALSFKDIGSAAFLSRALCGTARGKAVFCLPGSTGAASLAMERLILPEAGHLCAMLNPEAKGP
jgi:molybdenum cofactor biosynthesis protein B